MPLIQAGDTPVTMQLANLNTTDSFLDAVIVNQSARTVSVLLGRGDGSFGTRATTSLSGSSPEGLAVGEFTGDGKMDLAVGDDYYSGTITVLRGAGTGAFTAYTTLNPYSDQGSGSSFYPTALATSDLDGDGRDDLIVANSYYEQLAVYFGQDGGGFQQIQTFGTSTYPGFKAVAVADFTGDTKPDVAGVESTSPGAVKLFINSGGALVAQSGTLTVGAYPMDIAAGDLRHNGTQDLVVAHSTGVDVLLGQGNAAFANARTLATAFYGSRTTHVALGDVDHDGNLDIVASSYGSYQQVEVFYGDGTGNFPRTALFDGPDVDALAVGDLNGDGHSDVLATGSDGTLDVLIANPDGTLLGGRHLADATGSSVTAPAAADLNGDGIPDLIMLTPDDQTFTVFPALAPGVYDIPTPYPLGTNAAPVGLVTGDFTGEGHVDVVVADAYNGLVIMFPGDGQGSFNLSKTTPVTAITNNATQAIAAADFDHDTKLDVAVVDSADSKVWVLSNSPSTTSQFGAPVGANLPSNTRPVAIVAGRFSSGPGPDLAVLDSSTQQVITLINDGSGNFSTSAVTQLADFGVTLQVTNGDGQGQDDLIVAERYGVEILTGTNGGTFNATAPTLSASNYLTGAALADLNGDTVPDLVTSGNDNLVHVYLPGAAGTFGSALDFPAYQPGMPVVADLDGSGTLDVLAPTYTGASFWLDSCWH